MQKNEITHNGKSKIQMRWRTLSRNLIYSDKPENMTNIPDRFYTKALSSESIIHRNVIYQKHNWSDTIIHKERDSLYRSCLAKHFNKRHFTKDPPTIVPVDYSFPPMHFEKVQIQIRKILKTKTRNTTENIENHQSTDKTKNRCKKPTTI